MTKNAARGPAPWFLGWRGKPQAKHFANKIATCLNVSLETQPHLKAGTSGLVGLVAADLEIF